jgi:chemotaxis protein MotA
MNVIAGYVIILAAVLGGFALAGGHLGSLVQPTELIMIFGAAMGAFVVTNTGKVIKATLGSFGTIFKGSKFNRALYMELLAMLYDILSKIRKEGMMSIEGDLDKPEDSPVFSKYPTIVGDHHIMEFITDYLRIMVGGNLNAFELENLMDVEIETHHHEAEGPVQALARLGDGLPAFGIVAAVMGVVHTMESVGLPPSELGKLIAAALVGTFLGILLAYGFVGPLSTLLEQKVNDASKVYQCIKTTLLASLNGYAPQVAVEFGRKTLYSTDRPTFAELEEDIKNRKSK